MNDKVDGRTMTEDNAPRTRLWSEWTRPTEEMSPATSFD